MYKGKVETCGKRIAAALKIRGMRQAELCKYANVPKSSLSLYLQDAYEPKQDRLYDMARALNVSEAWLLGYDVPMERGKTKSPEEQELDKGEEMLLELFRQVPEDDREFVLQMIEVALKKRG